MQHERTTLEELKMWIKNNKKLQEEMAKKGMTAQGGAE